MRYVRAPSNTEPEMPRLLAHDRFRKGLVLGQLWHARRHRRGGQQLPGELPSRTLSAGQAITVDGKTARTHLALDGENNRSLIRLIQVLQVYGPAEAGTEQLTPEID